MTTEQPFYATVFLALGEDGAYVAAATEAAARREWRNAFGRRPGFIVRREIELAPHAPAAIDGGKLDVHSHAA